MKKKTAPRAPEKTRRALIAAAGMLFNEVGYDGTDSNRIARTAGFAPGTFYNHFVDKRAIFIAVYRDWVDAELATSAAAFEHPTKKTGRSHLARGILDHHRRWKVFRASLRSLSATDPIVHGERIKQRERQIAHAAALLRDGGVTGVSRERIYGLLLTLEIICDAIADGDVEALGISEKAMIAQLEAAISALFRG
jgi:AcrR family transcriptional regulator